MYDKALVDVCVCMGSASRVWGFTHLLSGSRIGADCNICEQVFIEGDLVVVGRVTVKFCTQRWQGLRLEG